MSAKHDDFFNPYTNSDSLFFLHPGVGAKNGPSRKIGIWTLFGALLTNYFQCIYLVV